MINLNNLNFNKKLNYNNLRRKLKQRYKIWNNKLFKCAKKSWSKKNKQII